MADPMVSVCMITYNHESYIAQAIEGVLAQKTDFDFKLIIGEDCSTDNTFSICKLYQSRHPDKIKLSHNIRNIGTMPNFIKTLKQCTGNYIAFCEGDDYWIDQNKLQNQVNIMEANPDHILIFTDRKMINEYGKLIQNNTVPKFIKDAINKNGIIGSYTPPTQTVLIRNTNFPNKIFSDLVKCRNGDVFLFGYLATLGKVGYIDEITSAYRIHPGGIYSSGHNIDRLYDRLKSINLLIKNLHQKEIKSFYHSKAIIYERLFVIHFYKFNPINFLTSLLSLIKLDTKLCSIYTLKAILLLFKYNKTSIINISD